MKIKDLLNVCVPGSLEAGTDSSTELLSWQGDKLQADVPSDPRSTEVVQVHFLVPEDHSVVKLDRVEGRVPAQQTERGG